MPRRLVPSQEGFFALRVGFEQLGGPEVRGAAERFFSNPGMETLPDFQAKAFPVYNRTPPDPEFTLRSVTNFELTFEFFRHESKTFNFLPQLSKIKCPTLVTSGDRDPITPLADSQDIAAAIPREHVRLEVFEGAGHGAHRDEPDRYFKVLDEFILS